MKSSLKKTRKKTATERVAKLLELAKNFSTSHPFLSNRYCKLIEKIRTSVNLRLTKEQKRQFCKKCYTYWTQDKVQVRINHKNKRVIYKCLNCGHDRSWGFSNLKNKKRPKRKQIKN